MKMSQVDTLNVKKKIEKAAVEVFSKKGYEASNIQDIADKLGITRGPIYYHFKNKSNLYQHIFEKNAEYLLRMITSIFEEEKPILDRIRDDIKLCLGLNMEHRYARDIESNESLAATKVKSDEYKRKIFQVKVNKIQEAIDAGELKDTANADEIVKYIFATYHGLSGLKINMGVSSKEIDILIDVFLQGLHGKYIG